MKRRNEKIVEKYTIIFSDGSKLTNLTMNGNNFVSSSPIDWEIFKYNMSTVTIQCGDRTVVSKNMELIKYDKTGEEYWFILSEISESQLKMKKMQSQIDYLMMMTGIE